MVTVANPSFEVGLLAQVAGLGVAIAGQMRVIEARIGHLA